MITKELLNAVRTGFDEAVAELGHKHNLRITLGGIRFGEQNATGKIEISLLDETGTAQTTERTAWETHAQSFRLEPEWLDQTFLHQGKIHRISGLNLKAVKYPVQTTAHGDKQYKWPANTIKRLMKQPYDLQREGRDSSLKDQV